MMNNKNVDVFGRRWVVLRGERGETVAWPIEDVLPLTMLPACQTQSTDDLRTLALQAEAECQDETHGAECIVCGGHETRNVYGDVLSAQPCVCGGVS